MSELDLAASSRLIAALTHSPSDENPIIIEIKASQGLHLLQFHLFTLQTSLFTHS